MSAALVAPALVAAALVSSCDSSSTGSDAGPPSVRVCGRTLAGGGKVDISAGDASGPFQSYPSLLVVTSRDCTHGADVSFTPAIPVPIEDAIHASDGGVDVLRIRPVQQKVILTARANGVSHSVTLLPQQMSG